MRHQSRRPSFPLAALAKGASTTRYEQPFAALPAEIWIRRYRQRISDPGHRRGSHQAPPAASKIALTRDVPSAVSWDSSQFMIPPALASAHSVLRLIVGMPL
jgi:hypothetical protein